MAIDNYISELTLPNNTTVYKIKDIEAREELEKKQDILEWDYCAINQSVSDHSLIFTKVMLPVKDSSQSG